MGATEISFSYIIVALSIEGSLLLLRSLANVGDRIVESIPLLILSHILYLVAVFLVLRPGVPAISLRAILLIALVFRATIWPLYPALSDDVYRYRWEGKLQAEGGNPYQTRPIDARWTQIRDQSFPHVGSKDFKSIYGPLIELLERFTYWAVKQFSMNPFVQVSWFKLPGALFDLGIMAALISLLRQYGMPEMLVLIYAWSPAGIVEFWGTGHNDSIPLFFILLALLMAARNRWMWAFGWLSVAVVLKLWPIVLFPAFALNKSAGAPRWYQWLVLLPITAAAAVPYLGNVTENAQFLTGFVGGWRNNDSIFGAVLWLSGGDLYRAKYASMAMIGILTLGFAFFARRLETAVIATVVTVLLVSANCHPWYLTWFTPFLVFCPYLPLFLWSALMPISYSVLIGWNTLQEWNGSTPLRWLVYGPVFGFALLHAASHWIRRRR